MKKIIAAAIGAVLFAGAAAQAADITGAGATFPAPVYTKWASAYKDQSGVGLNYQGIGSGGGIKAIKAKTVDFGASDKPLKQAELDEAGLIQFPTVVGGIVPLINVPGIQAGKLKLTGALLADIFQGKITKWNDAAIAKLNPGLALPNLPITVVHRSDGSGTSFVFTSYLSQVSASWAQAVGANDAVAWPVGVGGKGNDGVAAMTKQTVGAIGYVEYAYAKQNREAYALVQNKDGAYPLPGADSFAAAASQGAWDKQPVSLLNMPGKGAWPIVSATFILMHKKQTNAAQAAQVLKFFDWAYKFGDQPADALDYVALPAKTKGVVRTQWHQITGPDGKPVYVAK